MEYKNTLYEKSEGVATITINRPKVRNAINEETILEILSELNDAKKDESIKVIVITGAGDLVFSSGADINTLKSVDPLGGREFSRLGQRMCDEIEELEKPVIAAINGPAFGGGLELAMACDLRVASENANLGLTEINVGLVPGWGGTQRLPRFVGTGVAKEMIFMGKRISAKDAERLGLVNKVVPHDQLKSAVVELANEITKKPSVAIQLAKELINSSLETPLAVGTVHEAECFRVLASTEDLKEGLTAFFEKRKPKFKGK